MALTTDKKANKARRRNISPTSPSVMAPPIKEPKELPLTARRGGSGFSFTIEKIRL